MNMDVSRKHPRLSPRSLRLYEMAKRRAGRLGVAVDPDSGSLSEPSAEDSKPTSGCDRERDRFPGFDMDCGEGLGPRG